MIILTLTETLEDELLLKDDNFQSKIDLLISYNQNLSQKFSDVINKLIQLKNFLIDNIDNLSEQDFLDIAFENMKDGIYYYIKNDNTQEIIFEFNSLGYIISTEKFNQYKLILKIFYIDSFIKFILNPIIDNFYSYGILDNKKEFEREIRNLMMSLYSYITLEKTKYKNEDGSLSYITGFTPIQNEYSKYLNNIMELCFELYKMDDVILSYDNNYFFEEIYLWNILELGKMKNFKANYELSKNLYDKGIIIRNLIREINRITTNIGFYMMFNDDRRTIITEFSSKEELRDDIYINKGYKQFILGYNLSIPIFENGVIINAI